MLKYLRIAVTALSLTACVLLIALWVRSYQRYDMFEWSGVHNDATRSYGVELLLGRAAVYYWHDIPIGHYGLAVDSWPTEMALENEHASNLLTWESDLGTVLGFRISVDAYSAIVIAPMWFLATLPLVAAVIPWVRFSLRTLLIATTLVALGLGAVIYLATYVDGTCPHS